MLTLLFISILIGLVLFWFFLRGCQQQNQEWDYVDLTLERMRLLNEVERQDRDRLGEEHA